MTTRARQTLLLLRPLVRAVPWAPLVGVAALMAAMALAVGHPGPAVAAPLLRVAAIAVGAAGAFALVDPMGAQPVPTPRWLRQWLRVALLAPPSVATWVLAAILLRVRTPAGLVAEAVVCALVGFAGAAYAGRYRHTGSAALTGVTVQSGLVVATLFAPTTRSPWAVPGDDRWDAVHRWWWLAVAVAVVVLLDANREPRPGGGRRLASAR